MAVGKKRMSIPGLVPGEEYVIQVRAIDEGSPSVWSAKNAVTTIDDTAGGTRTPVTCTLTSFDIDPAGTFVATWPTVNANSDGTALVVKYYEFRLVSPLGTRMAAHYGSTGIQRREWTLPQMKALWGGTLPSSITASIRVVNSAGTAGGWSNEITASIPVPYMPTMVVPPGQAVIDGIKVMWGPPVEPYVAGDPRWPAGYRVYWGTTAAFVPDPGQKSNMLYQGEAFATSLTTLQYETDHYFKVASYSSADLQSDYITIGPYRPVSPYGPDDTPPLIPSITSLTLNADRSVSGQANITWTVTGAVQNEDIAGFVVAWKLTTDTLWRNNYFGKTERSGVIDLPRAFGNYDFKIAAYDDVGNYSAYSASQVLTGAGDPPLILTGVDAIVRWDGMRLVWNHSESQAVLNGGKYEIQFKTTNSFTDDVPTYTTSNKELDVAGLNVPQGTYYWRVRAVDVILRAGPWSAVQTETLPAFPTSATKDGFVPATAPQNVKVVGGLNYINASWSTVSNTDAVHYEVYMSTTSGFTISTANFAGQTSANSLMINSLPGSNADLLQNTLYYVKVRAVDADGPGPVSAQASDQLTQIAAGDLGINMSGENLLYNTSFETDSDANGIADYWVAYNNSAGAEPHTVTTPLGGRTGGKCQRISWTGVNSSTKGIYCATTQQATRPNTEYTVSFYAKSNGGTGFGLAFNTGPISGVTALENPTPSATVWNRYIFKFTTGATADANNFFVTIQGHTVSGGWIEFDDIQLEAGNIASAYKVGTVSIAKLATGTLETAVMTVAAGGQIKSADYNLTNKTGFLITSTGINLLGGTVNAATLAADTTITSNLFVGSLLQIQGGGRIQSSNYVAGSAGFRIDASSIDIRTGTVGVGTLAAGTITSPAIVLGVGGKITVDSTGAIQSNNYVVNSTGWKISSTGIEMWDANSKINVSALETGTLSSAIVTIGSGGEIKSANWNGTSTGWRLSETGFTLYNGAIQGSTVRTDQLYSITVDPATGKYAFSLNAQGYAEFSGAWVHGNMRVSNSASNVIQSGNYNGSTGWQIQGGGVANFFQLNTWSMNVYNSAKVGNSSAHSISSANYSPNAAGWIIRGDGYAEFNGGDMRLGAMDGSGGMTWLLNSAGNGQIRFYVPGDFGHFHYIRSVGQEFWMQGGWGGYIHIAPDNTVYMASNVHVSSNISGGTIGARGNLSGNGLTITTGATIGGWTNTFGLDGDPRFAGRGGTGFVNAKFNSEGQLRRDGSSRRYKNSIRPLTTDSEKILALEPKLFKWNNTADAGTGDYPGFIAEDAHDLGLTDFVTYTTINNEVVPDGFRYPEYVAALAKVARDQNAQIKSMEARLAALENLAAGT